ncbi:MAG: hypothetical protein PHF84_09920 [bacterium]|nr:hypothetical protein [bacterium]
MPKPTKSAGVICTVCSILALAGIILGLMKSNPLIITFFLLPGVVYEVYRTEGKSTKLSSIILLVVFILEIILILFKINIDLSRFLGRSSTYVAHYNIPLGDIRVVGPGIMVVLSIILFLRTNGIYTKWLSVIIFITSFALIYTIDPVNFGKFLNTAVQSILYRLH